ncbi:baseplate J/gp47 family protein [Actinoplanes sp. NPDC026619]|uniref:baseplate J/gp47 family protein n=1 Tax=Actinoplanes sp. NPDC026619 TaxID=3155798 RepID=UPI0033E61B84
MSDRLAELVLSTQLNGIDFIEITTADQTGLRVHFVNRVPVDGTLTGPEPVTIDGGESVPAVPVEPIVPGDWSADDQGRPTLNLRAMIVGDFSVYRLRISSPVLDPFRAEVGFTFKAGCPSELDCEPPSLCAPPGRDDTVIDYLAKDFGSFRAALLDFSAREFPDWLERAEPDLGMMLIELLSAVADELSWTQDRIAAEATLATATQRRSVVRHARLVDYEPLPARSARTLIQLDVAVTPLPAGLVVEAAQPGGGRVGFELGDGLIAPAAGPLPVDPRWNRLDHTVAPPQARIVPYRWDDSQDCLAAGATEMWVAGTGFGFRPADPIHGTPGTALLIETAAPVPAEAPAVDVVHLTAAEESVDPLFAKPVTRLAWDATEALTADHALERTVLAGNLVPATQGRRHSETFVVDPEPAGPDARLAAVSRAGPDAGCGDPAPVHGHTLIAGRLAWLTGPDGSTVPEIRLTRMPRSPGDQPQPWRWRRSLLDADPFESAYTVDPVRWTDLRAGRPGGLPFWEYDGDDADSIRFGTGVFGDRPPAGGRFEVTYRVTGGAAGNVAAGAITIVPAELAGVVLAAVNPLAATGGADEETPDHVRATAPHAFRAHQLRAVRAADYSAAARELPWVRDAGTAIRWTGSWLSVATTAQPAGAPSGLADQEALLALLDRRRMTGYEVQTPAPQYLGLDLVVTVCARPSALRGEVAAAIGAASAEFFALGRHGFGAGLERSALEAAVQAAPGVAGVLDVRYRLRGRVPAFVPLPETVPIAPEKILRLDNDPSRPEFGSLRIVVEGGK